MDPFISFQDEDNTFNWNSFSPTDLSGLSDLFMTVESPTPAQRSDFVSYTGSNNVLMDKCKVGDNGKNINKRVIDMLRRIPRDDRGVETTKGFRHMMRERQRREKLSQSYADLYSLIATRSKSDKNSIVQSATIYLKELKGVKDALEMRNEELKRKALISDNELSKIKIRVENPISPIDSLIEAMRCLKTMDVKARAIQSQLSTSEFSAIMSVDPKIGANEVERVLERTLMEVEKKLHDQLLGINIQS